jgi:hypothetical protein
MTRKHRPHSLIKMPRFNLHRRLQSSKIRQALCDINECPSWAR